MIDVAPPIAVQRHGYGPAAVARAWWPVTLCLALIAWLSTDRFADRQTAEWMAVAIRPESVALLNRVARTSAHLVVYAILGISAVRATRTSRPLRRLGIPLLVAACTVATAASLDEMHQRVATLARSGTPANVALDMLGGLAGALLAALHRRGRACKRWATPSSSTRHERVVSF